MKIRVKFLVGVVACTGMFCSCDKTTTEIPVSTLTIELDEIPVEGAATTQKAEVPNSFSATRTINLSDIDGLSEEAVKYSDKIESVKISESTTITITTTDNVGTVIEEFVFNADGVAGSLSIPQYDLGTLYVVDANKQAFVETLLLKLFVSKSATLNVAGKTDITSGEKLKVKITVKDMTLVASLLKTK